MIGLNNMVEERNNIEEFVSFYTTHDKMPVFLWGAGRGCTWYIKLLHKYHIPINAIIDNKCSELAELGGAQLITFR